VAGRFDEHYFVSVFVGVVDFSGNCACEPRTTVYYFGFKAETHAETNEKIERLACRHPRTAQSADEVLVQVVDNIRETADYLDPHFGRLKG
jgi:hypothetical protein